ncbi:GNAT family N-acetyltransferase [Streptomyces sp. NPDC059805]|uniref:GNAT family N-acetyltransferase n=1 Tax=Streptomyces sp. NPDC059805 TaxID=3346954 RepID=UPI003669B3B5
METPTPGARLSDGVITLTPLGPDDASAHLAGEDEQLIRWLSGGPGTPEGVAAYVRHCVGQWADGGSLRAFGVRVDGGRTLAGTIDLRFAAEGLTPGQVNVAYGLYPAWRGRGLATRAVLLVCGYAAAAGARAAVIQVEPGNAASVAVARRAGFAPGGQRFADDGTLFDRYVRELG